MVGTPKPRLTVEARRRFSALSSIIMLGVLSVSFVPFNVLFFHLGMVKAPLLLAELVVFGGFAASVFQFLRRPK